MANITKPAVERHSCDIAGCASMAENPMYWGVSFPVIAQDNYDDGSYFGGTRTRIINRTLDLCEHHAGTLLVMSDGTWRPDGFDSDVKGTAGDVRDYLSQWVEEQS